MTNNKTLQQKIIEQRQTLSPQKQALLAKRLKGKASPQAARCIMPVAKGEIVPVSYSQQRLWFVQQLDPAASWYNRSTRMKITGELDVEHLEQTLNHILTRHEVLRTAYVMKDGELCQKVDPPSDLSLQQEDFSHLEPVALEARIGSLAGQPFDLTSGKLARLYLFRLAQDEHLLLFVTHHIAFDRWSEEVFIKEVEAAYQDQVLPELSIQYADFAAWQRSTGQEARLEPHLSYWKNKLGGDLPVLKLPEDHARPAVQDNRGGSLEITLPAVMLKELKELAHSQGSTLFMLLLAAYKVLLYRYSGETDLIVGSPIAGRIRPEVEPLIGCFINNLVLRTDLSGNPPFVELLQRLRKVTLEAYQHQEVPFELLVRELQIGRDMSRAPLFQTMFNFENIPQAAHQQGTPGFQLIEMPDRVALYDLSVGMTEQDDCLACKFIYSTALFELGTIQRLAGHYTTILDNILVNPHEPIATIPMLTATERQHMLVDWNMAKADYPIESCLHHLFEHWADETPHELAIVFKDQKLTYGELESRANKIAHHLIGLGIGPESKVALFLDRSPDMIVGILGVLKAGGVYVPLDTLLPQERLAYMLKDSDSNFVLVHKKYSQKMTGLGAQVLCYEDLLQVEILDEKKPQGKATSDNLAYIIYTSGSTGKPKGVMVTHRNVIGLLYGFGQVTQDGPHRVNVCVSPFNFDVSVGDIFSTLCFGGTLHLLLPENFTNGDWYAQYLVENGITTGYVLPNLLEEVSKAFKERRSELNLKILITGLAPKKESILQSFREIFPGLRILNSYGPTEVTIRCTGHLFTEMKDALHDVPIGVPYPNYQVYIVDANLQPLPVGVAGELLIGGVGIARGYNQRPGLTAEKFIPDPFGSQPGGRLYRSGDIVRYLPDGIIEFLGRVDDQVKVSGYRIELGEIESHLTAHPMVQKCLAMVREDQPGDKRLVAYVIPTPGDDPTGPELRSYLAASLPAYMLPSQIILLDALPMLTNGKVNRSLLPAPDQTRPELEQPFIPAGTPTEAGLTAIWNKLLGIERIGIHDNFFELGGHSLLAIRMIAMTKDQLGFELPLSAIFEKPSIYQLSKMMDTGNLQPRWKSLLVIQPAGEKEPLFLVPPSAFTGMKFSSLAKQLGNSQPIYSFNHLGLDGKQEPQRKVEDMAALYVSEMLAFKPQGPYLLGGMCFGTWVALEMAQQLKKQGQQVSLLVLLDPPVGSSRGNKQVSSKKDVGSLIQRIFSHFIQGTFFKWISRYIFLMFHHYRKSRRYTSNIRFTKLSHGEASRNYKPQSYPGRVVFFQSADRKKRGSEKWDKILTGKVDYCVVPNSYHQTFLNKGKNLQIVANLINNHLIDLQSGQASQKSEPDKGEVSDG